MAEVLVIGKKISEMGLVNEITGEEKIPTSALGDKAVTTGQLLTYVNNNGVAQWGRIGGDITDQVDLQNQFTQERNTLKSYTQEQVSQQQVALQEHIDATNEVFEYTRENGSALPYREGISYGENAVVVKDGVLQQWKGGEWRSAVTESLSDTIQTFNTPEAGVDPVAGVADSAYFNVRSPSDETYADEYQNVGGVPTLTGKSYPSGAALTEVKQAIIDPVTGLASASKVFDESGNNQQDINNKTVFLSDYINSTTADNESLQEFLSLDAKNKVVDVNPILITNTVYVSDNIDFNGAEILALTDFNVIKKSMLSLAANAKAANLVVNGNDKNVRGISLQNSYAELDGVLVKNTKYLGIEGLGETEKVGLKLNKIKLENVCTTGVAGDLGYGGIAIENSVGGWYDHIDMNGIGAKGFRLRHSRNNTGYNHTYHDVREDQAAVYLASGENNNLYDVTITGTRNSLKFSRGEKNSHVFGLNIDNTHVTDSVYSVALMLQGTTGCTINNFNIKKGNGYGIRVEPHPADSDPFSEQPCIDNTLTGGTIDSVGTGEMLYLIRSSSLLESRGNEFNNLTLNGNGVATTGLQIQNLEDAVFNNLNISGVNGYDVLIAGSAAKFNGGSLVSAPSAQRKISIVGGDRCNIEFNSTKIKGSTTADRYVSSDVTAAGGRVAFVGCTDIDVTAATHGLYFAGASTLDFVSNVVKGSKITIGNNIIGGSYKNNTTTVATSIAATTMDISGLSASKVFDPPSIPANNGSITTTIGLSGVALGDVVQAAFSVYHADIEISAVVSAVNIVTVKMKNTGGAPVDLASGTLKVKLI